MTRKHFQAIAEQLADLRPTNPQDWVSIGSALAMWSDCVYRMANVGEAANPRFDRDKFYAACGMIDADD